MEGECQTENHRRSTPATSLFRSQNFKPDGPDTLLIPMLTCPIGSDDVQLLYTGSLAPRRAIPALLMLAPLPACASFPEKVVFVTVTEAGAHTVTPNSNEHAPALSTAPPLKALSPTKALLLRF